MISGFTVVRNAVALGYPFVESIRSVLPICDEFVISEGFSGDRTWEGVQALAKRFPNKIRVRRDRWTDFPDDGEIIARISNLALQECRSEFCLYLQANEIVHEESLDAIASLPRRFPAADLFGLPFYNILGRDILWLVQNRYRFFRRTSRICVTGDGYQAGYRWEQTRGFEWGTFGDRLLKRFGQSLPWLENRSPRVNVTLPQPVFRYRALFPSNYLQKVKIRRSMALRKNLRKMWDDEWAAANNAASESGLDPCTFWSRLFPFFDTVSTQRDYSDVRVPASRKLRKELISPAILSGVAEGWEYSFDASLSELAKAFGEK